MNAAVEKHEGLSPTRANVDISAAAEILNWSVMWPFSFAEGKAKALFLFSEKTNAIGIRLYP